MRDERGWDWERWHLLIGRLAGGRVDLPREQAPVVAAVVVTDRGVEIPLFGKGWGPLAVHSTLAEIEALPELEPGSRRV